MRKRTFVALAVVTFLVVGCGDGPRQDSGSGIGIATSALTQATGFTTAQGHGMNLVLPIPWGLGQTITRSYYGVSHQHWGDSIWDDRYGLDFAGNGCTSWNTPVVAVAGGVVDLQTFHTASVDDSYGDQYVLIDHGNGCYSHYGHLESRSVSHGHVVAQGQVIGMQGNRGNVSGSSCDDGVHGGTHLHFKMFCGSQAIIPEPMSGFEDFGTNVGTIYGGNAYVHYPVGTLVQVPGQPEIYLVSSDNQLLHVSDWLSFTSHRLFYRPDNPAQRVAQMPQEAKDCYATASGVSGFARYSLVQCTDSDYVVFEEGGAWLRRRVPFAASDAKYQPLVHSWGLDASDRRTGTSTECNPISPTGSSLTMRPCTVVESASDIDFWVITSDEYRANDARNFFPRTRAVRLNRNESGAPFMPKLYGTYGVVLQIPDNTITSFVNDGIRDGTSRFGTQAANICAATSGGTGGGQSTSTCSEGSRRCANSSSYSYCVMDYSTWIGYWSTWPCPFGWECTGTAGQCTRIEEPPTPHAISCERNGNTYTVSITGPIQDGLWSTVSGQTVYLEYGSNTDGWNHYVSGKPLATWVGDWNGTAPNKYRLVLSTAVQDMNFFLYSPDSGQQEWFNLTNSTWAVSGDCSLVGTTVHFSDSSTAPATGSISCTMVDSSTMAVDILGPVQDLLVGGSVTDPIDIEYGSNTDGWSVPYTSGKAKAVWNGLNHHTFTLSPGINEFNLYLRGANGGQWFDLVDADWDGDSWQVTGDCWKEGGIIKRVPAPPVGTISCETNGTQMFVNIAGQVQSGIFGTAPAFSPTYLEYGSDTDGWGPYTSGKPSMLWTDSNQSYATILGSNVQNMNFFLYNPATGQVNWFDLNRWTVTGNCWRDGGGIRH